MKYKLPNWPKPAQISDYVLKKSPLHDFIRIILEGAAVLLMSKYNLIKRWNLSHAVTKT